MVKVKNINGIKQPVCSCGSWLNHWENYSGHKTTFCIEINCLNKDITGGFVQKADSPDSNWYIIPLCQSHNNSKGEIEILESYVLVPADIERTCKKKS